MILMKEKTKTIIHDIFEVGIFIKFLDGCIQVIAGIILLFISPTLINETLGKLFTYELMEDPHDFIATHILSFSSGLSISTLIFMAIYLLLNGLIKIGLVISIWQKKLWAYTLGGVILYLFLVYEIYLYFRTYSPFLLFFIIVDAVIISLLRFDYLRLKKKTQK